ncbi:MAG: iron-sulfur cluster assembly scaffold protein, partial [Myxococcota bacterium]
MQRAGEGQREHEDGERIRDAAFEGSGCAISVASASLLTDTIIGAPLGIALDYFDAVTSRLTSTGQSGDDPDGLNLEKIRALDGVREF